MFNFSQENEPDKVTVDSPKISDETAIVDSDIRTDNIKAVFLLLGIFTLTVLVYSNIFQNSFTNWDDNANVYENLYIRNLNLENLKIYFSKPLLGMYTPLVYLSYAVDYQIGKLNPAIYHASNLLLHLINTALVFFVIRLMTHRIGAAALGTLVFAVHPMNVPAITPVSVRSSLLYSIFYLGAFISYIIYLKKNFAEKKYLVLAAVFLLLSLLSKSAAVVFPLLMLLTDWYYERRFDRKAIVEKVPFFVLSLTFGILTIIFRQDTRHAGFEMMDRVFLVSHSLVFYLFEFVAPFNLSTYYPYPDKIRGMLPAEFYAAPVILLIFLVTAWGIAKAREYRTFLVYGMAFFLIHIALVLRVVPVTDETVSDRYAYLPYIGLLFTTVQIFHKYRAERGFLWLKKPTIRKALLLLTAGYIMLFSLISFNRNPAWKDSYTLWTNTVQEHPGSASAHRYLGFTFYTDGRLDEAIDQYEIALRLSPYDKDTHLNLGAAYYDKGLTAQAIAEFETVLMLNPNNSKAHNNLGRMLCDKGLIDDAVEHYKIAIKINPDFAAAYNGLGVAFVRKGLIHAAINAFSSAQRLDPNNPNYRANLMKAYEALGEIQEDSLIILNNHIDPAGSLKSPKR